MANIYIVATPIGNLKDITYRAVEILKGSELIICEDTRVSKKLLDTYEIKPKLVALNEFNEDIKSHEILEAIKNLSEVSIISDAGTPLLSDPGYKFVNRASKMGHKIIPVPGPSAILASLVASTLPTDKFIFLGFLPKSEGKKSKLLQEFKNKNQTIIIFESPHRVIKTLETIKEIYGNIVVSVARELTKRYEEICNLPVESHLEIFKTKKPKGEFTLTFNPSITQN